MIEIPADMLSADILYGIIEEFILLQPDQYLWVHRRFKNRPEGEADVYQVARKKRSERKK